MQIGGEALEPTNRVRISIGADGHVMRTIADIDPGSVRMHDVQSGVLGPQPSGQFLALLAIQFTRACRHHVDPPRVSQTRCGPVCDGYLSLSNGVAILIEELRRGSATRSAIAETGAMLLNGQGRASASKSAVACRTGSPLRSHAFAIDH